MISVKRPYGGFGEGAALAYIHKLAPDHATTWIDTAGNLHIDTRQDKSHRTLFVAHVDTVHREDGKNAFTIDDKGVYHASGAALGADDGAGIAILSVLMQTVPAYFLLARGEEVGGHGSKFVAKNFPKLLAGFDRAIAFDRRGSSDIITHQFGGRSASDAFAEALSDQLNNLGLLYMPAEGIYTDTAEFTDLIPECTNISCGYQFEHSDKEQLDSVYLAQLCEAALQVDWDSLPVVRVPGRVEFDSAFGTISYSPEFLAGEQDTLYPTARTDREMDIEDAFFAALEGEPDDLMNLVGKNIGRTGWQLDYTLFEPQEIEYLAQVCHTWQEVIDELSSDMHEMAEH
jgi:hypothetical protein